MDSRLAVGEERERNAHRRLDCLLVCSLSPLWLMWKCQKHCPARSEPTCGLPDMVSQFWHHPLWMICGKKFL